MRQFWNGKHMFFYYNVPYSVMLNGLWRDYENRYYKLVTLCHNILQWPLSPLWQALRYLCFYKTWLARCTDSCILQILFPVVGWAWHILPIFCLQHFLKPVLLYAGLASIKLTWWICCSSQTHMEGGDIGCSSFYWRRCWLAADPEDDNVACSCKSQDCCHCIAAAGPH